MVVVNKRSHGNQSDQSKHGNCGNESTNGTLVPIVNTVTIRKVVMKADVSW